LIIKLHIYLLIYLNTDLLAFSLTRLGYLFILRPTHYEQFCQLVMLTKLEIVEIYCNVRSLLSVLILFRAISNTSSFYLLTDLLPLTYPCIS